MERAWAPAGMAASTLASKKRPETLDSANLTFSADSVAQRPRLNLECADLCFGAAPLGPMSTPQERDDARRARLCERAEQERVRAIARALKDECEFRLLGVPENMLRRVSSGLVVG
jgi:hypothetical protein